MGRHHLRFVPARNDILGQSIRKALKIALGYFKHDSS